MPPVANGKTRNRPRIGLNTTPIDMDDGLRAKAVCHFVYIDAVAAAGGVPVLIPPYQDLSMLDEALAGLDGFCFMGGPDYDPSAYGGHPQKPEDLMHPRRHRFDIELARRFLSGTRKPALGICGGHQLFNIALGGALVQDIASEWTPTGAATLEHSSDQRVGTEQAGNRYRHRIRLAAGSRIARAISGESLDVNSFHHQAIDPRRLGHGLAATAWSDDGIIEAVELQDSGRFVVGVQWHPEKLADEAAHAAIFAALVRASSEPQ